MDGSLVKDVEKDVKSFVLLAFETLFPLSLKQDVGYKLTTKQLRVVPLSL